MRVFLLSISLLLWSVGTLTAGGRELFPTAEGQRAEYAVTLDFGRAHLTGICVVKRLDGALVGTVMNEFGIRAFDFRYDPRGGGVKLSNPAALLDRWYIRRTLRRELALLLRCGCSDGPLKLRGRRLERGDDGSLRIIRLRRPLHLGFTPLNPQ